MANLNDKLISYGNLAEFHNNLLNDSSVSVKATWSSQKISAMIADAGFDVLIVAELPATGDPHTIYFILKQDSSTGDVYDEWMYLDGNWEMVGNTQIDLSDYAKILDVDASLALKADKTYVDSSLALKADKASVDASLSLKQDVLTAGQNIAIDASNNISAEGYVFDSSNGSLATIYRQDEEDGGALVANVATGLYCSYAEGYQTVASGNYGAHSEGQLTTASGSSSHAEGIRTSASGSYSHAEGAVFSEGTFGATGDYGSHAEGYETLASGIGGSHAEGAYTAASGGYGSHAEGYKTIASGLASHAEGGKVGGYDPTTAAGKYAHAEGESTSAEAQASHTEGSCTQAKNPGEHAQGVINLSHKVSDNMWDAGNTLHSIGIGYSQNYVPYRKNAHEIMQNGDQYIIGIGGYEGTDTKVQNASIKTVQEVINGKADAADLSSYATLAYVDSSLNLKAELSYVDASLALKADAYEVATTADILALFAEPVPPTPAGPAHNEIWYTTEYEEIIPIGGGSGSGAGSGAGSGSGSGAGSGSGSGSEWPQVLTNVYEDGKGVITFAEDITELPSDAFNLYNDMVTSVTLPASVVSFGNRAFLNCQMMTTLTCYSTTPPTTDSNALDTDTSTIFYVPAESVNDYKTTTGWSAYASRIQAINE